MERIYPVTESVCMGLKGRPICAVMQDGKRYYGIVEGTNDGKLIINGYSQEAGAVQTFSHKKGKGKKPNRAKTSAFYPGFGYPGFGYPGWGFGSIALSLAAIAVLFALPFFW